MYGQTLMYSQLYAISKIMEIATRKNRIAVDVLSGVIHDYAIKPEHQILLSRHLGVQATRDVSTGSQYFVPSRGGQNRSVANSYGIARC